MEEFVQGGLDTGPKIAIGVGIFIAIVVIIVLIVVLTGGNNENTVNSGASMPVKSPGRLSGGLFSSMNKTINNSLVGPAQTNSIIYQDEEIVITDSGEEYGILNKEGISCSYDSDCKGTNGDKLDCDEGKCQYKLKDWAGVCYRPSKCKGTIFGKKGTCEGRKQCAEK